MKAPERHQLPALVRRAQEGDESAWEPLFTYFQRKIVVLSSRFKLDGFELEDKIQVAKMGLIKAVRKYDEDGGRNIDTWAELVIKQALTGPYRKLTSDSAVPPSAIRSADEKIGDDLLLGESIANPVYERSFEDLAPRIRRLEERQARCLRRHLSRPMSTPFGDVLFLWAERFSSNEMASLILDVCDRQKMPRIWRFGHEGDVFDACGDEVEAIFMDYLNDQRRLIVTLAKDARWGHPAYPKFSLDPVRSSMRKLLVQDADFVALAA